jgi:hypothetical protein
MLDNVPATGPHTNIGRVTHLQVHPGAAPTALRLAGGVGPVLESTCVWGDGPAADGGVGVIRAIDASRDRLPFGLGAAAFGDVPEQAVRWLGEYLLVDGASWWTPAADPSTSRYEAPTAAVLTPFLFRWDGMRTATASLESPTPVPLIYWYEYLLRELVAGGACPSGAIALKVVADVPARLIVDKQLSRAPLLAHRPADGRLITDESHLDQYFVRNAAARAYQAWCTVVMVGIAMDPASVVAMWGPEVIERGFYTTPGVSAAAEVIQHTHALVTAALPGVPGRRHAGAGLDGLLTGAVAAHATHIENDTMLYRAEAHIGAVSRIDLD